MFNNVDTTNLVTNSGGEEVTISPGYYTLSEIIAILNTMTNTSFSITTMATSYGCILIQFPYSIDFTTAPDVWEIIGLGDRMIILPASFYGSNVIYITRNRQVIQVYSSLVRSFDMNIANQNNNNLLTTMIIDDPTNNYYLLIRERGWQVVTIFDIESRKNPTKIEKNGGTGFTILRYDYTIFSYYWEYFVRQDKLGYISNELENRFIRIFYKATLKRMLQTWLNIGKLWFDRL